MSESDCTAGEVQLVEIELQILADCDRLCCKCLICLIDVEIVDGHVQSLEELCGGSNRAYTHDAGIYAAEAAAEPLNLCLDAELFSLLFAHNYDCCCAIVDTGSITGCDDTVFVDGAKLCKSFSSCAGTRAFILIEDDGLLFLLDFYRNDLLVKPAVLLSLDCLLLAAGCKLIELFTGQSPLLSYVISCADHVIVVECIPKSILDHGVNQNTIVHSVTIAALLDCVRSHGHVLCTACNNDVSIAGFDHLCCHVDGIQTGTADNVDCNSGAFDRKAGLKCALTCHVLSLGSLDNTAHNDFVNLISGYIRTLQSFFDNDCAELCCRRRGKAATHFADCCTACTRNNNFLRHT